MITNKPSRKNTPVAVPFSENELTQAMQIVVDFFGRDGDLTPQEKINFQGTAERVSRAWIETTRTKTQIVAILDEVLKTSFPVNDDNPGMVIQGPIKIHSFCPHHLLPVEYEAFVAYAPVEGGQVVGLSKIARATEALGKRPILQEQLAKDIADVFFGSTKEFPCLQSAGSAVSLIGRHSCMSIRGIECDALTATMQMRGIFADSPTMEMKFHEVVRNMRGARL